MPEIHSREDVQFLLGNALRTVFDDVVPAEGIARCIEGAIETLGTKRCASAVEFSDAELMRCGVSAFERFCQHYRKQILGSNALPERCQSDQFRSLSCDEQVRRIGLGILRVSGQPTRNALFAYYCMTRMLQFSEEMKSERSCARALGISDSTFRNQRIRGYADMMALLLTDPTSVSS